MSTAERARGRRPAAADLLTIGEVLGSLRTDFPDVTPSKVRFLEDRGLVTPARTPSGYRKFAPAHVARLRLVLTLQRDHYLPLKVIAEHLAALDAGHEPPAPVAGAAVPDTVVLPPSPPVTPPPVGPRPGDAASVTRSSPTSSPVTLPPLAPSSPAASSPPPSSPVPARDARGPVQEPARPAPTAPEPSVPSADPPPVERADAAAPPSVLTFDALVEAAGGDVALVDGLTAHGLLPRPLDGGDAVAATAVVRAAVALGNHGIEPRHLRVLRTAAEREAALVEQVAAPLRRVRGGDDLDGRAETVTAHLCATLGDLRSALLVVNLPGPPR